MTRIRFSTDDDLIKYESSLDRIWPRKDKKTGEVQHDWDVKRELAVNEINRRLKSHKDFSERFELGRVGQRSREDLRDCEACLTLHYIFVDADTSSGQPGNLAAKAAYYKNRADSIFTDATVQLDYDMDNDGAVEEGEKNQPAPNRFIRG